MYKNWNNRSFVPSSAETIIENKNKSTIISPAKIDESIISNKDNKKEA